MRSVLAICCVIALAFVLTVGKNTNNEFAAENILSDDVFGRSMPRCSPPCADSSCCVRVNRTSTSCAPLSTEGQACRRNLRGRNVCPCISPLICVRQNGRNVCQQSQTTTPTTVSAAQ